MIGVYDDVPMRICRLSQMCSEKNASSLKPRFYPDSREDVLDVLPYRRDADVKLASDLKGRGPRRDKSQHVPLATSQAIHRGRGFNSELGISDERRKSDCVLACGYEVRS